MATAPTIGMQKPAAQKRLAAHIVESARAAAMACHTAAGLSLGTGVLGAREAARLLRAAESLCRSAVTVLVEVRDNEQSSDPPAGGGNAAEGSSSRASRRRSRRKGKGKGPSGDAMKLDEEVVLMAATPTQGAYPSEAKKATARSGARVSPYPLSGSMASTVTQIGPLGLEVGATVLLDGLLARPELNSKMAIVNDFDSTEERYSLTMVANQATARVKASNLRRSTFPAAVSGS